MADGAFRLHRYVVSRKFPTHDDYIYICYLKKKEEEEEDKRMEIDEFANDYRLKDKFISTKDYRFSSSLARFID